MVTLHEEEEDDEVYIRTVTLVGGGAVGRSTTNPAVTPTRQLPRLGRRVAVNGHVIVVDPLRPDVDR